MIGVRLLDPIRREAAVNELVITDRSRVSPHPSYYYYYIINKRTFLQGLHSKREIACFNRITQSGDDMGWRTKFLLIHRHQRHHHYHHHNHNWCSAHKTGIDGNGNIE